MFLYISDKSTNDKTSTSGQLMEAEELERGAVSLQVYAYLFKSMGWPLVAAYLVSRILQEVGNIGRQFWLAVWSQTGVNVTTDLVSSAHLIYHFCKRFCSVTQ